jgi:cysteine desulfuration protein SufE
MTLFDEMAVTEDWEIRYQLLIEAGNHLIPLTEVFRTDQYRVPGCLSPTWIKLTAMGLDGYSKSHIVMGLIALLKEYIETHPKEDIKSLSLKDFSSLSIDELITPTRQNGFASMIELVKQLV